ncbi:MAG: cytochrome c oxidase subunit 4 [Actinomycetales bacterium]|nr:cytochrome c oxidase subunit 4 [Actinomycetales bacterium]
MKIEGWLFSGAAIVFSIITVAYWLTAGEIIGTLCIALSGGLAFLAGFYILYTGKRVGPRPEDREDADISEADVDYGFFSPHSWWPLPLAASAAMVICGLIFAPWVVALGTVFLLISIFGFTFEYYRGTDLG